MNGALRQLLEAGVRDGVFPAAQASVFHQGQEVGRAAVDAGFDTPFDLASLTKVLCTATAFVALWAEGKVGPSTPVSRWVDGSPLARNGATLGDLLDKVIGADFLNAAEKLTLVHDVGTLAGSGDLKIGRALDIAVHFADSPERQIVMVEQFRHGSDTVELEIPGGMMDAKDGSPEISGQRELREETGCTAARWREIARAHLSNSVSDEEAVCYLATGLRHGDAEPEGTEELQVRWVPFAEALAMALDGRITDALSVVALQRVALLRQAGGLVSG